MTAKYTIVENAGYVGERDITSFPTQREARAHRERHYDRDELDSSDPNCLHVYIRYDWTDEDGKEQSEFLD